MSAPHKKRIFILLTALALLLASLACSSQAAPAAAPTAELTRSEPTAIPPATDEPPAATNTIVPATAASQPKDQPTESPTPTQVAPSPTPPPPATNTPVPTTAPTAPLLDRTLSLQSPPLQGDDVLLMQQRLAELGYAEVGEPDGVFGQMTQSAVIRFQADQGLTADGIVGPLTWAALWGAAPGTPVATGPTPTSEYSISRTLKLPYPPVGLAFDGQTLWVSCGQGDQICGYDPATGGYVETKPVGVCGYSCSLLYLYYADERFLAVQYADLGEINPLTPSGYYLVSDQDQPYYRLSDNVEGAISFAGEGGRIWIGTSEQILVVDPEMEAEPFVPPVAKTIYRGGYTLALLYADGLMWAATGDATLAIDPETYQIVGNYPLAANSLAFDGERIWGASSGEQWVRAFDPATQRLSTPIPLPGQPIALAFDGQNLWVALWENPELLAIPIE